MVPVWTPCAVAITVEATKIISARNAEAGRPIRAERALLKRAYICLLLERLAAARSFCRCARFQITKTRTNKGLRSSPRNFSDLEMFCRASRDGRIHDFLPVKPKSWTDGDRQSKHRRSSQVVRR